MDYDRETHQWHAARRRRDAEDIREGKRTPEQVNRDNTWIPNAEEWVPLNLVAATLALKMAL